MAKYNIWITNNNLYSMKLRSLLFAGFAALALSLSAQTHEQGIEYYKADQLSNAKELLNRNLNNPGTDKSLSYYYLGQIEMYQKNYSEAEKYFNDGINADPNNPYNYVGLGYLTLKKTSDAKAAEKYFKEAESKAKKDYSVQVEIARAYYNANPVLYKEKYEKIIETVLKKDPKNPDVYILQGDILRDEAYAKEDAKVYGQAASKYDMAISYDPTSAVAYVKYADMYTNAKNPQYGIQQLENLIKANPTSALGQRQLADAYYEVQEFDKAATQYGNYVKNPNHFKEDEDRYSLILFADGKYKDGYDYSTQLLKSNPSNFTAQRFQFMNAAQIKDMESSLLPMAEKLLQNHNANKKDNKFAAIDYTLISDVLSSNGRNDDAVAVLQEGIKEMPANANFNKQLAVIYLNAEDYGKAADAYSDYVAKLQNPDYSDYTQQALYAYFGGLQNLDDVKDKETGAVIRPKNPAAATKYFNMAKDAATKGVAVNGEHYKAHKILGDVAKDSGPADQVGSAAVPEYLIAAELLGDTPNPSYNNDAKAIYAYLAAYYVNSNPAQARNFINKALAIDPNNATYQKIAGSIK